ncbi:cyclic pyranopterin monophosphate synthase MoaC [Sphingorhabdus sp. Alg239-R122]|uniref:cyclic pyranopterin monophosphate synthase MoaC n=1 Tax=Sphingorhabdus sp. Alg239-R122 TaxID=2305989 RepID=UPI0013DB5148|nr:cyclic pyranopterin monophosphate synthase MoaC [Sphingorhabdus sp. Alg239-R122]
MQEKRQDELTHFDGEGRPQMVDVSGKPENVRTAAARGRVLFTEAAYRTLRSKGVKKGDVRVIAELAGIQAAKQTATLIPLCHPLPLSSVKVQTDFNDEASAIDVTASVRTAGQTGVEMEALTAVSVACLTIYDMAKAIDKDMTIADIQLVSKTGGKSGDFERPVS